MTRRKGEPHFDDLGSYAEHRPKVTRHHLTQEIAETRMHDQKVLYQLTRNLRPGLVHDLVGYMPEYSFEKRKR